MKKILIVEDDAKIAAALEARFRAQGYDTATAKDALTGASAVLRYQPDLILLDIMMPGGSGLELARNIQAMPETRNTPFILITASKDPQLRAKAMKLRAAGLFEKPYDAEELIAVAQYAMGETGHWRKTPVPVSDVAPPSTAFDIEAN